MRRRKRRHAGAWKILGLALGLSGVILMIHNVPLYVWYAALAAAIALLLCLIYITT